MPTVSEVLKASGWTDDEIKALDAKKLEGFTTILTTADQEREKAELAQRAVNEKFENEISPALANWANEKAAFETKEAAYQAALKAAKEGGFTVPEILATPNPNPNPGVRDPSGRFVPGANQVPGSPGFEKKLTDEVAQFNVFVADTSWKYRTLFGQEMPDSPSVLVREAGERHMIPSAWAAQKYKFQEKEQEKTTAARKAETDAAIKDALDKNNREWGEKVGSNPNVRMGRTSEFSEIHKAVKTGTRPDPIAPDMTEAKRDAGTRRAIQAEVSQAVN